MQVGAEITQAYGFVDLTTPGGIPYETVLGIRRDPLQYITLRVSNMKATQEFLSNTLGGL